MRSFASEWARPVRVSLRPEHHTQPHAAGCHALQQPTLAEKAAGLLSGPTGRMLRPYTSFSSAAMPEGVRMADRAPPVGPVSGVAEAQACGGKGQGQQA